jgi:hypothetical protein
MVERKLLLLGMKNRNHCVGGNCSDESYLCSDVRLSKPSYRRTVVTIVIGRNVQVHQVQGTHGYGLGGTGTPDSKGR